MWSGSSRVTGHTQGVRPVGLVLGACLFPSMGLVSSGWMAGRAPANPCLLCAVSGWPQGLGAGSGLPHRGRMVAL